MEYQSQPATSSSHPSLFPTIDATYVIHLEGNGRLEKIKEQFRRYRPSHTCIIVFNKGYKKCNKPQLGKQLPPYDLIDANLHVMRHAKQHQYKTVLILEDDFFFDEEVSTRANEIDEFLLQRKDTAFCYYLGCVPALLYPSITNHNRVILRGASHSVVYSDAMMGNILTYNQKEIEDWDLFLLHRHPSYTYYKPLCYQLFPETDNQRHWGEFKMVYCKIMVPFMKQIIQVLKMDTQTSPGYPFFYFIAKASFWIHLLILLLLVYFIVGVMGGTKTVSYKKWFSKR
jgi:hypothetical protein